MDDERYRWIEEQTKISGRYLALRTDLRRMSVRAAGPVSFAGGCGNSRPQGLAKAPNGR